MELEPVIRKGFVLDDNRMKNGGAIFGKDYFRELLECVRSIRASERRIWQQITDIYAECSIDYDRTAPTTKDFYAMIQNKFHYAISGKTAAEIVYERADRSKEHMGLTTWKNSPDGDASKARWAPFIFDSRYAGEKLGAFLSAANESARVYSSTENSIMRSNFPGEYNYNRFNAPSREAIWQRVQVLAHPEQNWSSWEDYVTNGYNREEFVSFDLSPAPAAVKPRRLSSPKRVMRRYVLPDGTVVERKLPPLHPPVIMER